MSMNTQCLSFNTIDWLSYTHMQTIIRNQIPQIAIWGNFYSDFEIPNTITWITRPYPTNKPKSFTRSCSFNLQFRNDYFYLRAQTKYSHHGRNDFSTPATASINIIVCLDKPYYLNNSQNIDQSTFYSRIWKYPFTVAPIVKKKTLPILPTNPTNEPYINTYRNDPLSLKRIAKYVPWMMEKREIER